jgi:AcrR family transcriptional regulator
VPAATPSRRPYAPRLPAGQRREQVLDAALAVALEQGFHAVTVDGVARATGVTRPVVYGLFADRTELLAALLDRSERRALEQLVAVLPGVPAAGETVDPDELLVHGVAAYLTAVRDDPDTWRVILVPPEGAPAELRERVDEQHRQVLRHLRQLVVWGLERRGGPADMDVDLFARSVLTLAEGAARLVLAHPQQYPVERFTGFVATLMASLTRGAGPAPGR